MVYTCFVAKMLKMAFTRFGGQFQFEKSMLGRLDNLGAGVSGEEEIGVVAVEYCRKPQQPQQRQGSRYLEEQDEISALN